MLSSLADGGVCYTYSREHRGLRAELIVPDIFDVFPPPYTLELE
jgi:hypothetical protein